MALRPNAIAGGGVPVQMVLSAKLGVGISTLPLDHRQNVANRGIFRLARMRDKEMERKTRFELATPSLARRCSTTEPLPLAAPPGRCPPLRTTIIIANIGRAVAIPLAANFRRGLGQTSALLFDRRVPAFAGMAVVGKTESIKTRLPWEMRPTRFRIWPLPSKIGVTPLLPEGWPSGRWRRS